jgi:diadenylate cyclase
MTDALALVAPGRPLREGLDRVLQAKRGALVVVGDDPAVLSACTGGFLLDAEFSPQRLSELCKMDGAIILAPDASRIARANVHLVPRASIPTTETGTRHRTAERVARSLDVPVITVSESMSIIAVYRNDHKQSLQPSSWLVDRAGQALLTLQRFRTRFDLALATLSTLEVGDAVAVRDVVAVLQPGEMVVRIAEEMEGYLVELGDDGRHFRLQLEELAAGVGQAVGLVVRDYVMAGRRSAEEAQAHAVAALTHLSPEQLLDPGAVAAALGLGTAAEVLDEGAEARGYRQLHRLPRVPDVVIDRLVDRFRTLPGILQASTADLASVGGVGAARARAVKEGLGRMVEASILERYD